MRGDSDNGVRARGGGVVVGLQMPRALKPTTGRIGWSNSSTTILRLRLLKTWLQARLKPTTRHGAKCGEPLRAGTAAVAVPCVGRCSSVFRALLPQGWLRLLAAGCLLGLLKSRGGR